MSPDVLLRHASALRAVARGLLHDDDDAVEDVLQETFATALVRRPRSAARLGGWLASVTRSQALQRLRGEGRRREREERSARAEELEPAADLVERKALLRRVVDELLALDEPYQTVLFLRYFEGLPPREIARRLGRPDLSVRSQLHRGLERLRGRLDRGTPGGRDAWATLLLPVAGLHVPPGAPRPTPSAPPAEAGGAHVPLGGTAMTSLVKLALLLAVAVPAATLVLPDGSQEEDAAGASTVAEVGQQDARAPVETRPPVDAEARRSEARGGPARGDAADATDATGGAAGEAERTTALALRVTDSLGRPTDGADVYLGPLDGALNLVGRTDERGELALRFELDAEAVDMLLAVRGADRLAGSLLRRFEARVGGEHATHVVLPAAEERASAPSGRVHLLRLDFAPEPASDEDGPLRFRTGTVERTGPASRRAFFERALSRIAIGHFVEDGSFEALLDVQQLRALEEAPSTRVTGTVLGADGRPAGALPVALLRDGALVRSLFTDARGRFELEGPFAGELELVAGGDARGLARATLAPEPGTDEHRELLLDLGLQVRGVLCDGDGHPLAGWTVELARGEAPTWGDLATTDEAGRFALANVPDGALRLLARPAPAAGSAGGPPALVRDDVRGGDHLELVARAPRGSFAVELSGPDGTPVEEAEVRVLHEDSGRAVAARGGADGVYTAAPLAAGPYRVLVGAGALGWSDLGRLWLGADEEQRLPVRLTVAPGTLAWTVDTEDGSADRAQRLRILPAAAPLPSIALDQGLEGADEVRLPPGSYDVELVRPNGARTTERVELGSGARVEVALEGVLPGSAANPTVLIEDGSGYFGPASATVELEIVEAPGEE